MEELINSLQDELKDVVQQLSTANEEIDDLKGRIEDYEETVAEQKEEIEALHEDVDELDKESETLETKLKKELGKTKVLESNCKELNKKCENQTTKIEELIVTKSQLEAELKKTKEESQKALEESESSHRSAMERKDASAKVERDRLLDEIDVMRSEVASAKIATNELKLANLANERLEADLIRTREDLARLKEQSQDEVSRMKVEHSEHIENTIQDFERQIDMMRRERENLSHDNRDLAAALQGAQSELSDRVSELESTRLAEQELRDEQSECLKRIREAAEKNTSLSVELLEVYNDANDTKDKITAVTASLKKAEVKLGERASQVQSMQEDKEKLVQEVKAVQKELHLMTLEHRSSQERLNTEKDKCETLRQEANIRIEEMAAMKAEVDRTRRDMKQVRADYSSLQEKHQVETLDLKRKIRVAEESLEMKMRTASRLEAELQISMDQISDIRNLSGKPRPMTDMPRGGGVGESRFRRLDRSHLSSRESDLLVQLESARETIVNLKKEITQLRKSLERAADENSELELKLRTEQEDCSKLRIKVEMLEAERVAAVSTALRQQDSPKAEPKPQSGQANPDQWEDHLSFMSKLENDLSKTATIWKSPRG